MDTPKHTCLKLEIPIGGSEPEPIFVKGTWYPTRFDLSISDGLQAWTCHATAEEVKERASYWDQTASDYIDLAERHLGFQQPGSVYGFSDAGEGCKRLSWTFEKEGMKLEWRWKCQPSPNSKKTTVEVLDFLMDANIKLSVGARLDLILHSRALFLLEHAKIIADAIPKWRRSSGNRNHLTSSKWRLKSV